MPTVLINPFDESHHEPRQVAPRLAGLAGATVGLLDISKPGGSLFLDHLADLLRERCGVARIERVTKPTFTKPAPDTVIESLVSAQCDAVIEALAD
jgi:hypothetical protein